MHRFGLAARCAWLTLAKWRATPRILTLLVVIVAFLTYHTHSLVRFAAAEGQSLVIWIFVYMMK